MFTMFGLNRYEHKSQPLASRAVYYKRIWRNVGLASIILFVFLCVGVVGYRFGGPMSWIDAVHNASMILSGMGPVAEVKTTGGKIFSSVYAIVSGVAFITNIGILLTPVAHRFFHRLHAEEK